MWLKEATSLVNQVFAELESRTVFHNSLPDAKMWNIANQLAEEAAIYPLDSIHVATAIHWGCSLFIATDRDLLDKINRYDATIQQLFRESLHLDLMPAFEVVPLTGILRMYPPKTPGDAIDWLKAHGFD